MKPIRTLLYPNPKDIIKTLLKPDDNLLNPYQIPYTWAGHTSDPGSTWLFPGSRAYPVAAIPGNSSHPLPAPRKALLKPIETLLKPNHT